MESKIVVARCHEIQIMVNDKEVHRFERLTLIGQAVRVALHIRDLPSVDFELLKTVCTVALGINRFAVEPILKLLADIGFVHLSTIGTRILSILPTVPFYDDLYSGLAEYMDAEAPLDEFEALTVAIVDRLAQAPANTDQLAHMIGAERKAFNESVNIGTEGQFLIHRRARAKDILINPTYYSENADIFADHVAKVGAPGVSRIFELLKRAQGWPLELIVAQGEINGSKLSADDVVLLQRLAEDGAVKPPSILMPGRDPTRFVFTPTPGFIRVGTLRRDIYEKALAIVSAIRLGQLLPGKYRIHSPKALISKLRSELKLGATSDYNNQYKNLIHMRIATLEKTSGSFYQLKIIDNQENREALTIAHGLIHDGSSGPESTVDQEAVNAMTNGKDYVESLLASKQMRTRSQITLSPEAMNEMDQLLLAGKI